MRYTHVYFRFLTCIAMALTVDKMGSLIKIIGIGKILMFFKEINTYKRLELLRNEWLRNNN